MALDFPSSPTNGQTYTYGSVVYYYDSGNTSWTTTYVPAPDVVTTLTAAYNDTNNKVAAVTSNSTTRIWANTVIVGSTENVYIDLANSGVTATTYGGTGQIPAVTVDAYGRLTSASNVSFTAMDYAYANTIWNKANGAVQTAYVNHLISGTTTLTPSTNTAQINIGVGNVVTLVANTTNNAVIVTLPASGVTATTYGGASQGAVLVVDAYGRITSASNVALTTSGLANTSGVYFNGSLFFPSGNVGIGLTSTSYSLQVNGSFAANTKSFVIDHPTKSGMKLRYGSLEGPENGVYVRGRIDGTNVIELPDYWEGLVDLDTISVSLTSIGHAQNLYVATIDGLKIHIDTENHTQPYCYYQVYAERKDVEKLVVEY